MTEIYEWILKRAVEPRNTADDIPLTNNQITYTVGRSSENDIVCTSDLVSREHCLLFRNENNLFIQDLKSVNGVFINGQKQKSHIMVPLKDGDIIGVGSHETCSADLTKFVYQVHKQVVVDLEREHVKMEVQSSNCEEEIRQPPNKSLKLIKFSESDQKVQNLNLADEILKHKTPSTDSEETFDTSSPMKMGIEISVNKDYKGPVPNTFVNEMPQSSNFLIGAKIPETVCSEKNASLENSKFRVTEISRENSFPLNSTINISDEEAVSTSPILIEEQQNVQKSKQVDLSKEVEMLKESVQPQMHEQKPGSTNVENEKIMSDSPVNDADSDMLCTTTTNTSQSKPSEMKENQDVDLNLKSTNKKSFTVIQRNASGERREVLRFIDERNNSKESREILEEKDPTIFDEDKNDKNSNLKSSEIKWLKKENERFLQNAIPPSITPMNPRTCNSNKRQATSHGTNYSMNLNQGEINPAWENAFNAISALHNIPNSTPNLLNPIRFPYSTQPYLYSNPQNFPSNHFPIVYPNYQYPYPNYQMKNYLNPYQNYQIPCTNWTPSYPASEQAPYAVDQTLYSVPVRDPNFETPQLSNNQSQSLCTGDLSLPNSCSIEKTKEEKDKPFEEFSASSHHEAIEKTQQADGMKIKKTEAKPKIISSEIVNIPYKLKQQSQGNNNSTHSVPVKKFELDVKKFGELATCISADKLYRSSAKTDEAVMNIVSWRPAEFESTIAKEVPCVINPKELPKTQFIYNNYEDYYKVQIPLILVSISYQIKNAYKANIERTTFTKCEVVENTASIIWIENAADSYMIKFNMKLYGFPWNFKKSPEIGDFLRIKITKGDTTDLTLIFGYVTNILNSKVEMKSNAESVEMTLEVVIKLIHFNLYKSEIKEVSLIMSLLPSINLVKALDTVKESPVLPLILNPNPEDYELSPIKPDITVLPETSSTPDLLKEKNLNYKQLDAIQQITDVVIRQEPKVILIEGSPGSGKTEVIANTIIKILNGVHGNEEKSRTMKILVCTEFDSEIDEILCRVNNKKQYLEEQNILQMVRVGHFDENNTQVKDFSVKNLAKMNVENILKEFDAKNATMSSEEGLNQLLSQQMAMKEEIETKENNRFTVLRHAILTAYLNIKRSGKNVDDIHPDEYADLLNIAEHAILSEANVIICRFDLCYSPEMDLAFRDENLIPVLIIEEATQSIEIDILKPLTFGVQILILVADVCKRSTKYSSYPALEENGFNASLFKRLKSKLEQSPDSPVISFHLQYRMNKDIAYFPNKFFFQGKVGNAVASEYSFPLVPYRVFNWYTSDNLRKSEKMFVKALLKCITCYTELKDDSKPWKIGVITTSSNFNSIKTAIDNQMELISDAKRNSVSIEVYTLENFQNKAFDAIFASFFKQKSNLLLRHTQKMYSVITSAKHCLLLYGTFRKFDDETTSLWNCLINDARRRNMLVDIEAQPPFAKLKMHILKR